MINKSLNFILTLTTLMTFGSFNAKAATKTIQIGDYINLGTYDGSTILWRCVDIDEHGPLMLSDKILCNKAFDAAGTNETGSHGRGSENGSVRKTGGSNYWGDSNIRDWLNSSALGGKVIWGCGNEPTDEKVSKNAGYADEAGFLNEFRDDEISLIKEVKQYTLLDQYEYSNMTSYGSQVMPLKEDINSFMD